MDKRALRLISYALLILLVLSVLPLLAMGFFAAPSADDYYFGHMTHLTWLDTGSALEVLKKAAAVAQWEYRVWQGTFSAIFLMSIQPAVFSESLYALVPFILITVLCLSTYFLFTVIFSGYFGADKHETRIVAVTTALLSVQFVPFPVEAFYWYNGAIYYTGFHAFAMTMFALTLLSAIADARWKQIACCFGASLLGLIVGGGNLATALVSSVILALLLGFRILTRQNFATFAVVLLVLLAAFALNILAPGNAVRQANLTNTPPLNAVLKSFSAVVTFTDHNVRMVIFPGLAALAPLLYKIAKKSKFSFRLPVVATALIYCVLASAFTPSLYAQSTFGPNRMLDMIFYLLVMAALFTGFYWCGWIAKRFKLPEKLETIALRTFFAVSALAFVFLLVLTCIRNKDSLIAYSAVHSLAAGEAQQYKREYTERQRMYQDSGIQDMEVAAFSVKPHLLYFEDIEDDPENWKNQALCRFYRKNTVRLIE